MRAERLVGAMVALLMIGAGAAAQAPPAPARAGTFQPPVAPLTDEWLRVVPQAQRRPLQTLHGFCTRWAAAPDAGAQREVEEEARRAIAAMAEQGPWLGLVVERDISGDVGALTLTIAQGVFIETAGVGFLSMDTNDTRFARGSRDFQVVASVRRGDVVSYRVRVLRPRFGIGRCSFLARLSRLGT